MIGETGTSTFGISDTILPAGVLFTNQSYYGSIGWATPCALGCDLARIDLAAEGHTEPRRTILVTGDGSFGLTMQEVGTMINYGTKPILIIINNDGYTIERVIHGARQPYNNINKVNYSTLLHTYCHSSPDTHYRRCTTPEELLSTLSTLSDEHASSDAVQVLEIVMDKLDVPWRLSAVLAMRGPSTVEYLKNEKFSGWDGEGELPVEWTDASKALKAVGWEDKSKQVNGNVSGTALEDAPVGAGG